MTGHKDQPEATRVEIVEMGRRRRWTEQEKLRIVMESLGGPRLGSLTARRHGISRSLLATWRRQFSVRVAGTSDLVPAMVVPDPPRAALQVQEVLRLNPHGGDLFVFRGRRGHLLKVLWADGLGMSLYIKRLERGRFIWPAPVGGVVPIGGAQVAYRGCQALCVRSGSW